MSITYSHFRKKIFDKQNYLERTKRNRFWIGKEKGQMLLSKLKIGIAGLGGMGSNIAVALARLGVGEIRIADPDIIEISNINRQVIATNKTVGKTKVGATVELLRDIADDFTIIGYDQGICEETVESFVEGLDIIVNEIDVLLLDKHLLLYKVANQYRLPIYSAFVIGVGIHLYKFQGEEYTIEDFLGKQKDFSHPSLTFLMKTYGFPLPSYLKEADIQTVYEGIQSNGGIPIFGTSCLLGHSLVPLRLTFDFLEEKLGKENLGMSRFTPTPLMPEFLVLDPIDFSFNKENVLDVQN